MPLKVVVVGAGISGLATAIGFARHGHHVIVYERKESRTEDSGSGIQLQPNAMRILESWGLKEDVEEIAHLSGVMKTRRYDSGKTVGMVPNGGKKEQWYALRNDFKTMFYNAAAKRGVEILLGRLVRAVDESRPAVMFEDGSNVEADLVIGGDGTRSSVREALFPKFSPQVRAECVFQVIVPRSFMERSVATKELYDDPSLQVFMSPGRSIVASTTPKRELYDVQLIDHEYGFELDHRPEIWNERVHDMTWLRNRFGDFDPAVRAILAEAQSYWKWRITDVTASALPSWTSKNGKVVLVGDSAHAMVPYVGQGAAAGIEDAAVLSELFRHALPQDDLQKRTNLYEEIRRPRVELIQSLALKHGVALSLPDGSRQKKRDQLMQQRPPNNPDANPDAKAPFGSVEFEMWLDNWDGIQEAQNALKSAGSAGVAARANL